MKYLVSALAIGIYVIGVAALLRLDDTWARLSVEALATIPGIFLACVSMDLFPKDKARSGTVSGDYLRGPSWPRVAVAVLAITANTMLVSMLSDSTHPWTKVPLGALTMLPGITILYARAAARGQRRQTAH